MEVIVSLGGGLRPDGSPSPKMAARLDKAYDLFSSGAFGYVITTSKGTFRDKAHMPSSEAEIGKRYLIKKGLDADKILLEDKSMDTLGNAYFCRVLYLDQHAWHDLSIITNEFHLARTKLLFDLVLGPKYHPRYVAVENRGIDDATLTRWRAHEKEMISFYKTIFKDVKPGNLDAIKKYLFERNPAYTGNKDAQHQALTERIKRIWCA